jgi:hypothetical protein
VLTLIVATRGMRASERKRPMKSCRTVSYSGPVTRYKGVYREQSVHIGSELTVTRKAMLNFHPV